MSSAFLRRVLGLGLLSAWQTGWVYGDRSGNRMWSGGNFSRFLDGLLLLVGGQTRAAALLSGGLPLPLGVAMTLALGAKTPLNFAVPTGVGGALLLATCERFPLGPRCVAAPSRLDQDRTRRGR